MEKKKDNKRRTVNPSKYVASNKKSYAWVWSVLIVAVVAVVVAGGVYVGVKNDAAAANGSNIAVKNAVVEVSDSYIEFRSKDVEKNPRIIELFEDPRCPGCIDLEKMHGSELAKAVESNKVVLRMHIMDFLNYQGTTQYSTRANAALLTAALSGDAESTFRFHSILMHTAPPEGEGVVEPTDKELAKKAEMAGFSGEVVDTIKNGKYDRKRAQKMGSGNMEDLNKRLDGNGGTPSAFIDGKLADMGKTDWVTSLYQTEKK